MTKEQLDKIKYLNRLYYAEMKLKSSDSIKKDDKKRAKKIIELFPAKTDDTFWECKKEAVDLYKKAAILYLKIIKEYRQIREETEKIINSAEDDELSTILKYRYIEYKSWEEIAGIMYYSLRTIKYKHKTAIDKINI